MKKLDAVLFSVFLESLGLPRPPLYENVVSPCFTDLDRPMRGADDTVDKGGADDTVDG